MCPTLPEEQKKLFVSPAGYGEARKICKTCPAKDACLKTAFDEEEPGKRRYNVRGGKTAHEREKMFRNGYVPQR